MRPTRVSGRRPRASTKRRPAFARSTTARPVVAVVVAADDRRIGAVHGVRNAGVCPAIALIALQAVAAQGRIGARVAFARASPADAVHAACPAAASGASVRTVIACPDARLRAALGRHHVARCVGRR